MASVSKRSWKLQDFVAHSANVNCLALGHKSGRVMVTGGDDKKVNLWAIGKQSCFMSLSGHTTPIECVQFNHVEELVCAGSRAGALKVWDLEAAKLVRTLNGHKFSIKCVDFHPYGEFLASGSADSSIKMWDSRKKGCIFTYNGHKSTVNSIKFSPDGQWIASGGEDASLKIWDLRVGRVMRDFGEHVNGVTCVEFHPHEFLLASGSSDRSVQIYDLENFNVVSCERDLSAVRCLWFNPDGDCLYAGVRDYLKVVGWEPNRLYDSVPVYWGKICDISTAQNQLIGASYHLTNVMVHVVDLKKVQPFGSPTLDAPSSPFMPNQSIRKSFSKADRPVLKSRTPLDVKTIEESTSGTDPEEDTSADITNLKDYKDIFKGRDRLPRTPPPEPEPFQEPQEPQYLDPEEPQILGEIPSESFEALSLDNNMTFRVSSPALSPSAYSRSKSNLDQVFSSHLSKQDRENILPNINKNKAQIVQKYNLQRQSSCKEVPEKIPKNNNIRHSISDANISKTNTTTRTSSRKNSFSRPNRNSSVPNVSKNLPSARDKPRVPVKPSYIYVNSKPQSEYDREPRSYCSPKTSPEEESFEEFVPVSMDRPIGLAMDDFLPRNYQSFGLSERLPSMSEAEVLGLIMRGHEPMMAMSSTRLRSLKIVLAQFRTKYAKAAAETAVSMNDLSVLVDMLSVFNEKFSLWNLDLCVLLLPKLEELMQSKYETYMTTGCNTLKLILKHFGPVIKTNVQSPAGSFGVDISREERYRKSVKCHDNLLSIRTYLLKKQTTPGNIGNSLKEVTVLLQNTLD